MPNTCWKKLFLHSFMCIRQVHVRNIYTKTEISTAGQKYRWFPQRKVDHKIQPPQSCKYSNTAMLYNYQEDYFSYKYWKGECWFCEIKNNLSYSPFIHQREGMKIKPRIYWVRGVFICEHIKKVPYLLILTKYFPVHKSTVMKFNINKIPFD